MLIRWSWESAEVWRKFSRLPTAIHPANLSSGVARFAGGAIAISIYTTILSNTQGSKAAELVPAAAIAAGASPATAKALLAAIPLGAAAIAKVPGITTKIAAAGGAAFQQSYVHGLRITALSSLSFGVCGIIACICCNDIGKKMNERIEVWLENDENADKNVYH